MRDPIEQFADMTRKAEVEEAKYRGHVIGCSTVMLDAREARELLDAIRRLEREHEAEIRKLEQERDDALAEARCE